MNMNMFGQMDLGNIFGSEFAMELAAAEESKKKETKKAEKKGKAEKPKEKKEKAAKKLHVTLPCTVYGGSFKKQIAPAEGETEIIEDTELLKRLQAVGIDEAISKYRKLFIPEDNSSVAYIVSKVELSTSDDVLLCFGEEEESSITFAYGEQKAVFTLADFSGKEKDEISMADAKDKILELFPQFKDTDLGYDVEAGVIVPILNTSLSPKSELPLPITINNVGEEVTLGEEEVGGKTVDDAIKYLSAEYSHADIQVSIVQKNNSYFVVLNCSKTNTTASSSLKKNKGAKAQKKEEKYPSGAVVFLCFNGYTEQLSADKFGGKEKITKQDLIEYFKPKFAVFSSAEKVAGINCFYDNLQNRLSVDCAPGRRGAGSAARRYNRSWDYEEREVYNNESGADPMENAIFSVPELDCILHTPTTAFNRPVYCKGEYYGSMVYANKTAAYVYTSTPRSLLEVSLKIPKIPVVIKQAILSYFRKAMPNEAICKVVYDHGTKIFSVATPISADVDRVSVSNARFDSLRGWDKEVVATFHSHNSMPAFFSSTDDAAELDQIGIFGVIGRLDCPEPEIKVRAVYEGGVKEISLAQIFE